MYHVQNLPLALTCQAQVQHHLLHAPLVHLKTPVATQYARNAVLVHIPPQQGPQTHLHASYVLIT